MSFYVQRRDYGESELVVRSAEKDFYLGEVCAGFRCVVFRSETFSARDLPSSVKSLRMCSATSAMRDFLAREAREDLCVSVEDFRGEELLDLEVRCRRLYLSGNPTLRRLSFGPGARVKSLYVGRCPALESIEGAPELESLEAHECPLLRLDSIPACENRFDLSLQDCGSIEGVRVRSKEATVWLHDCPSLRSYEATGTHRAISVHGCPSLRWSSPVRLSFDRTTYARLWDAHPLCEFLRWAEVRGKEQKMVGWELDGAKKLDDLLARVRRRIRAVWVLDKKKLPGDLVRELVHNFL